MQDIQAAHAEGGGSSQQLPILAGEEAHALLSEITNKEKAVSSGYSRRIAISWVMVGFVLAMLFGLVGLVTASALLNQPREPTREQGLNFFIVGDFGREDNPDQQLVASLMGRLADTHRPSFVLSTGDNFYEHGLMSHNDPLFTKCFTQTYTAAGLQIPFYAVLGNHDYGDKSEVLAEGFYSPIWQVTSNRSQENVSSKDPRWNLRQGTWRQSFGSGVLDVIFIDTTPMVSKYHNQSWSELPGGVASQDSTAQLELMEDLLESSSSRFKIVVGHHPCFSFGEHCDFNETGGDCEAMSFLQPILQKHKVDVYFSGHDHNLQVVQHEGSKNEVRFLQVVSGAGSQVRTGAIDKVPPELIYSGKVFISEAPGFVAASIKGDLLTLDFWSVSQSTIVWSLQRHAAKV